MPDPNTVPNLPQQYHQHHHQQQQPPQYQQPYQQQYSPGKSPKRASSFPQSEPEMQHSTAILGSPSKSNWATHQPQGHHPSFASSFPLSNERLSHNHSNAHMDNNHTSNNSSYPTSSGSSQKHHLAPATYAYSFSSTPSIFETLLRESEQQSSAATRGNRVHESMEALQRLTSDVR